MWHLPPVSRKWAGDLCLALKQPLLKEWLNCKSLWGVGPMLGMEVNMVDSNWESVLSKSDFYFTVRTALIAPRGMGHWRSLPTVWFCDIPCAHKNQTPESDFKLQQQHSRYHCFVGVCVCVGGWFSYSFCQRTEVKKKNKNCHSYKLITQPFRCISSVHFVYCSSETWPVPATLELLQDLAYQKLQVFIAYVARLLQATSKDMKLRRLIHLNELLL